MLLINSLTFCRGGHASWAGVSGWLVRRGQARQGRCRWRMTLMSARELIAHAPTTGFHKELVEAKPSRDLLKTPKLTGEVTIA